jgi:transposase
VETILRTVERKHGKARRVWIFDRGVVSEENLVAIRKRGGQYLVGTPRSKLKQFEQELLQDDFEKIRPEVEVKQITIPGGGETYILCRTAGRKEKEKAIRSRFVTKIEKALAGLAKRIVEGKLKDRDKMFMSLGRIQASHPQVADLYEMAVKDSKEGPRLVWRQKPEQQQWLEAREGAYLLRTNLTVNGAADLWKKYMQLTEVEAAFRTLKSELAIRPLFHQLEKRVKAHVLVAFLGYALQVTLRAFTQTQWFGVFTGTSLEATLRTVQRRHRATDGRRTRDLAAQDYQAGRRSGKATQPTPPGVAGAIRADSDPEM